VVKHTKRWMILAAAAAVAGGALATGGVVAHAQGFGLRGPMRGGFGWAAFEHALDDLDVSEAQREQLRGVLRGRRNEIQALAQRAVTTGRTLADLSTADQIDEAAIRAQAAALGETAAEAALLRASIHAEAAQILTPEQQQKLREQRTRFRARVDERMKQLQGELKRRLDH